jgi:hypothetical protein
VTDLEKLIRDVIPEEVRRLIRPDAFVANQEVSEDDLELQQRAQQVAERFRRARVG